MYLTCSDEEILEMIMDQDDPLAFAELYDRYFRPLFKFTLGKVNDQFAAQEIVQELFISIWQQRQRSHIQTCRLYLFSVVKKLIISYYRKEFSRNHHYSQWQIGQTGEGAHSADQPALFADLQNRYEAGLRLLPPKCHEVFLLSRQGMANKEIAEQLNISEKTVEFHITKALKILKEYLKDHFIYSLILLQVFS